MPDTETPRRPATSGRKGGSGLPSADAATVEKIRAFVSGDHDLPETKTRFRYLILSQPRTGGTLLCEALQRSGAAGMPFEYLNPATVAAFAKRPDVSVATLPALMRDLERRRTGPNGAFGLNLHLEQLSRPLRTPEASFQWLRRFDRVIYLYRRDKLAQAVSLYRSIQSSVWFENEAEKGERMPGEWMLDPWAIARHVANFGEQEDMIRHHLQDFPSPVMELTYEALDRDFADAWRLVSEFLMLPEIPAAEVYPALKRMRDDASATMIERFHAALRDSDLALDRAFNRIAGGRR